jgi:hypothetical protein
MTSGSHETAPDVRIGTVIIDNGERVFVPWPQPLPH